MGELSASCFLSTYAVAQCAVYRMPRGGLVRLPFICFFKGSIIYPALRRRPNIRIARWKRARGCVIGTR